MTSKRLETSELGDPIQGLLGREIWKEAFSTATLTLATFVNKLFNISLWPERNSPGRWGKGTNMEDL